MNKSIILELVTGGKNYFDSVNLTENEEYRKCFEEMHNLLEKFCEKISGKDKDEIMWKFDSAQGGLEEFTAEEYFKRGFKLGLILAAQNFLV